MVGITLLCIFYAKVFEEFRNPGFCLFLPVLENLNHRISFFFSQNALLLCFIRTYLVFMFLKIILTHFIFPRFGCRILPFFLFVFYEYQSSGGLKMSHCCISIVFIVIYQSSEGLDQSSEMPGCTSVAQRSGCVRGAFRSNGYSIDHVSQVESILANII